MPVTQRATQIVHGSSLDPDFETTDEHEAHGHHVSLYFRGFISRYLITHRRFRTDEGRATEQDNLSHFLKFYEAMRSSTGPVLSPDGTTANPAAQFAVLDAKPIDHLQAIRGLIESGAIQIEGADNGRLVVHELAATEDVQNNEGDLADNSGSGHYGVDRIADELADNAAAETRPES